MKITRTTQGCAGKLVPTCGTNDLDIRDILIMIRMAIWDDRWKGYTKKWLGRVRKKSSNRTTAHPQSIQNRRIKDRRLTKHILGRIRTWSRDSPFVNVLKWRTRCVGEKEKSNQKVLKWKVEKLMRWRCDEN